MYRDYSEFVSYLRILLTSSLETRPIDWFKNRVFLLKKYRTTLKKCLSNSAERIVYIIVVGISYKFTYGKRYSPVPGEGLVRGCFITQPNLGIGTAGQSMDVYKSPAPPPPPPPSICKMLITENSYLITVICYKTVLIYHQ